MRRVLSLYLPQWSIDLARKRQRRAILNRGGNPPERSRPREPVAILLVTTTGNQQVVLHRCERSAALGVRPGMTLAHARALLPMEGLLVEEADVRRDNDALRALARWAMRFSPLVALDPYPTQASSETADGLLLDITGCQRLFRGERSLVNNVANAVEKLGFSVRVASASTVGCAWALARFGRRQRSMVPAGSEREALAPLPLAGLRIDQETQEGLLEVAIETIGQLMDMPREALPARFGADLLLRLDQAMGQAFETIDPLRPREPLRVEREFDGPASQLEAIEITVRELLEALTRKLLARESGARLIEAEFTRVDVSTTGLARMSIQLTHPSRDVKHLWSLLHPQVEKLDLGFGIERIAIAATRTGRISHQQMRQPVTAGEQQHDEKELHDAMNRTLDVMVNRLGPQRVSRLDLVETHQPDHVAVFRSVMDHGSGLARRSSNVQTVDADRPTLLLEKPEPIEAIAMVPDGPPSWLHWRGLERSIVTGIGPERIAGCWWGQRHGDGGEARDYFRVQDDRGCWLWVFRELHTGRWFVHGQWA